MRTIAVVTTARSDYGIYLPVLRAIANDPTLQLRVVAGGMHLAPEFGSTVTQIERDGFAIGDRVEMLLSSDTPHGTAKSMAIGVLGFAEAFARNRPDVILVLGDRFEMHAAALAALPFGIPVAHIHGGEVTEGAIDEALRHGITKMAHLHFAATEEYAARIRRMGEEPWRVTVSGAPALDNIEIEPVMAAAELSARFGVPFDEPPLLVTFHPVTRQYERTLAKIDALLQALGDAAFPVVFTMPNADAGGRLVAQQIGAFAETHERAHVVENFGPHGYFSAMRAARAMVGNSSSGIIEAASFKLPVVNIGERQAGRTRAANVIDVAQDENPGAILGAIRKATDPSFRAALNGLTNPYGSGDAAQRIVTVLRETPLDEKLLMKRFYDGERI